MTLKNIEIKRIEKLLAHKGSVYTLCEGEQENIFFSGDGSGTVIQWDLTNLAAANMIAKVNASIFSLCYFPQKNLLFIGQMHGGFHILDLTTKQEIKHLAYHKQGIFDIKIKNDLLYVAGGDGKLSIWDTNNFDLLTAISISDKHLRSFDFHPFYNEMAIGGSDNVIYILDFKTLKLSKIIQHHKNSVFSVKYSPDGKYLLSGSRDAYLAVWDVEKHYELYNSIPAHYFTINDIAYNSDGSLFATASRDKTIKLWNAANFGFLKKIDTSATEAHINSINKLLWKGNTQLVSCSDDRSVMVWEIKSMY